MNLPTVIITAIIAVIVAGIIITGIRNKKNGKTSCSCGCSACAFKNSCHGK